MSGQGLVERVRSDTAEEKQGIKWGKSLYFPRVAYFLQSPAQQVTLTESSVRMLTVSSNNVCFANMGAVPVQRKSKAGMELER